MCYGSQGHAQHRARTDPPPLCQGTPAPTPDTKKATDIYIYIVRRKRERLQA